MSPAAKPAKETPVVIDAEVEVEPTNSYESLSFKGDDLQVRVPSQQALAAFSLSTSKYISSQVRNDMTGMFINRHLSPESYEQVFSRLMDPDDEDYTVESIGELMRSIVELS